MMDDGRRLDFDDGLLGSGHPRPRPRALALAPVSAGAWRMAHVRYLFFRLFLLKEKKLLTDAGGGRGGGRVFSLLDVTSGLLATRRVPLAGACGCGHRPVACGAGEVLRSSALRSAFVFCGA